MPDCIFCKIISGVIPNFTVYEDTKTLAFLDINPHAKGHTVVIPKKHHERTRDMGAEDMQHVIMAVQQVIKKIDASFRPDGYNIGWNDGLAAGQVVPHLHIHVLPRWEKDSGGSMHSIIKNSGDQSVEQVAKLLK